MKILLAAFFLFTSAAFSAPLAQGGILILSSDKIFYGVGEAPTLQARLTVQPEDKNLKPFFTATLNDEPVSVETVGNSGFSVPEPITVAGSYTWRVQAYFEDAALAAELKAMIEGIEKRNEEIEELLLQETDLDIIQQLEKEKAMNESLLVQAGNQLEANRQPIGAPQSYSFMVN